MSKQGGKSKLTSTQLFALEILQRTALPGRIWTGGTGARGRGVIGINRTLAVRLEDKGLLLRDGDLVLLTAEARNLLRDRP